MDMRRNNKGFSLVEMMVAVAILSIVMIAVGWILSAMSKSFGNSQREVQLQDSVQTTYSIVSNLVKEAQSVNRGIENKYGALVIDGNRVYIFDEEVNQSQSDRDLKIPTSSATYHIIDFDQSKHKLYLYDASYNPLDILDATTADGKTTYTYNPSKFDEKIKSVSSSTIRKPKYLLSNNVDSFTVVDRLDSGYVVVELKLSYGSREASITQNVYLRNSNMSVEDTSSPTITASVSITATPTPTPSIGAGSGITLTNGGNIDVPDTTQISQHSDITVCYESGYDYSGTETTSRTVLMCPNNHTEGMIFKGTVDWGSIKNVYHCLHNGCQYYYSDCVMDPGTESNYITITEEGPVKTGKLEIKNTSLSNDYTGVVVTVYFQDSDAMFAQVPDSGGQMLTANTELSTGKQACTYYTTATDTNGRCKYIKITIPKLEKAEAFTENGVDKIRYDSYVFNYSWYDASGNKPVVCAYTIDCN
ncbi:MAG: type II secretion system protein J [Lachnospiraceae bacterium]